MEGFKKVFTGIQNVTKKEIYSKNKYSKFFYDDYNIWKIKKKKNVFKFLSNYT